MERTYCDFVCDVVATEDVPSYYARLGRFRNVGRVGGEDGVAVVGAAIAGEEADESLWLIIVSGTFLHVAIGGRTENVAILVLPGEVDDICD